MAQKRTNPLHAVFAIGILTGLSSCQSIETETPTQASLNQDSLTVTHEHNNLEEELNLNQQLSISKQDLADRLGIELDSIKIITARNITWRSGALGCPKPNMNYTQALVPGVLILLEADGKTYGFHAQKNQKPFHCPSKQAVIPDSIGKEDLA